MAIRNRAWAIVVIIAVVVIVGCSGPVRHQGPIRLISDHGPSAQGGLVVLGPTIDAVRIELSRLAAQQPSFQMDHVEIANGCSEQQCWPRAMSEPGEIYLATEAGTRCGPLKFYSATITADLMALKFEYEGNQCRGAADMSPLQPLTLFSLTPSTGSALPNHIRISQYGATFSPQVIGSF